jgi:hypothetical protein
MPSRPLRWERDCMPAARERDMVRLLPRMGSEGGVTLQGRPQPVTSGRLARTALLVVLIVLALGSRILDSRIAVGSSPVILAMLAYTIVVVVTVIVLGSFVYVLDQLFARLIVDLFTT